MKLDTWLVVLLLGSLLLRVHLAATQPYIDDEKDRAIPLARTISFAPDTLHLPLRGPNHGALPAYVVKISSTLFGTTPLGNRAMHVVLGLCMILLVYGMTREWYGPTAARWAAALLAFNEYFLNVSSRATAHVPHLFFVTAALFAFSRFLRTERVAWLYGTGLSLGLAFYCKEHSALLVPVLFIALMHASHRRWFKSPHVYLAAALFVLVIAPDLAWNLKTAPETATVTVGNRTVMQATYSRHLERIGGVGLSPYPTMFYGRDAVQWLHTRVTGRELRDETPEYQAMNPALGVVLLASVLAVTFRRAPANHLRRALLLAFWCVFGFFTFIAKGNPPGQLDPVSWIWVETTLIAASILTGAVLAGATGRWRIAVWAVVAGLLLYASSPAAASLLATCARTLQGVFGAVMELGDTLAQDAVVVVRGRPLWAVGLATVVGAGVGLAIGFWVGRLRRR